MTGEYSLADISAATGGNRSNDGFGDGNGWWIILLFIFIAAFGGWGNNGGAFGGGGNQGAAENYVLASDFATLQRQLSDGFSSVDRKGDQIVNGLCDGFYTQAQLVNGVNMNIANSAANITQAITTNGYENRLGQQMLGQQMSNCCCDIRQQISDTNYNIANQANGISRQIADCCCATERQIERGFADTNYNLATQNCATLQAIDKVGDRVIDYLANKENQNLRDENFALRLAASQERQNNYLVERLNPNPCPQPAYVVQPPQQVTFPTNCCGGVNYAASGCSGCNL